MRKNEILTPTDLRREIQDHIRGVIASGEYRSPRAVAIAAGVDYPNFNAALNADPAVETRTKALLDAAAHLGIEVEAVYRIKRAPKKKSA